MPTSTDLVTDLPADFETFGQAVDTSLADLKGGTSGQVLSKASNTDMDFTWVAQDDSNAIQNTQLTAKGALITAFSSATPATLTVGNNGETLVADSSTSTGLRYQGNFAAGKNVIINGDFSIWQRSTSATVTSENYFAPDRFRSVYNAGGATVTWSRQTFTPGAAPVAGYEGQYFSRIAATSGSGTTVIGINPRVENVQTFAGQTATISFWAKADSARTATILLVQNFGSGGSADVSAYLTTQAITTSWVRYSFTTTVASISGKTVGSSSFLGLYIYLNTGQASGSPQLDVWGVQMEAGSVATAFQTATGTIQGELAACQRYYYRMTAPGAYTVFATGGSTGSTNARFAISYPVTMRVAPTALDYSTLAVAEAGGSIIAVTSATLDGVLAVLANVSSGLSQYRSNFLYSNNSTSAYLGFSAEL
jgi:carbon monoxide dehydrogenase subunit G